MSRRWCERNCSHSHRPSRRTCSGIRFRAQNSLWILKIFLSYIFLSSFLRKITYSSLTFLWYRFHIFAQNPITQTLKIFLSIYNYITSFIQNVNCFNFFYFIGILMTAAGSFRLLSITPSTNYKLRFTVEYSTLPRWQSTL